MFFSVITCKCHCLAFHIQVCNTSSIDFIMLRYRAIISFFFLFGDLIVPASFFKKTILLPYNVSFVIIGVSKYVCLFVSLSVLGLLSILTLIPRSFSNRVSLPVLLFIFRKILATFSLLYFKLKLESAYPIPSTISWGLD